MLQGCLRSSRRGDRIAVRAAEIGVMRCVSGVQTGRVKRRLPPARWSVASGGLSGGARTEKSQGSVGRKCLEGTWAGASRVSDGLSDSDLPNIPHIMRAHSPFVAWLML